MIMYIDFREILQHVPSTKGEQNDSQDRNY